jgi:tau tubulin kinase
MGTPLAPAKVNIGDKIKDQYVVKKKLGEGSCGVVFLVQNLKIPGPEVGFSFNT